MIPSSMADAVQAVLDREVAHGACAGAVALVGMGAERRVMSAGGLSLGGPPVRRDSLFRIASVTKPVTAVAALMLADAGKFSLDEPVDRLLPELAARRVLKRVDAPLDETVPARRPIAVEDLLTFRLGWGIPMAPPGAWPIQRAIAELELEGFGPPNPLSPLSPDEWLRRLGTLPLMAQPGEQWLYTTGSDVLGVLVARAAGMPLPEALRSLVFEPLGMRDTGFHVPRPARARLAAGYRRGPRGLELTDAPATTAWGEPPAFPAGDAGLVSTIDDLFAFSRFMLDRGRADGQQLLAAERVEAMTTDRLTAAQRKGGRLILTPHRGWGYGVSVVTETTAEGVPPGAYGWNGGLGTSWLAHPGSLATVLVFTQTAFDSPEPPPVHRDVWRAVWG